jgi:hypothetical protein
VLLISVTTSAKWAIIKVVLFALLTAKGGLGLFTS